MTQNYEIPHLSQKGSPKQHNNNPAKLMKNMTIRTNYGSDEMKRKDSWNSVGGGERGQDLAPPNTAA